MSAFNPNATGPIPWNQPRQHSHNSSAFSPAVVAIISVLGSAFLVVSYYRIFAKLFIRWQNRRAGMDIENQQHHQDADITSSPMLQHGLDEALIKKIPIFEYKRGDAFTVETECAVCLMDFTDKQELRMLPKCAHAFHVPCIDTWLGTHSTCPLCRANIYPDHVTSRYPSPQSQMGSPFFSTPQDGSFSPADYSMGEFARFSNGHGRSPGPTLRGLLNYEDQQRQSAPTNWGPDSESGRGEPGEESLRLYNSRDYGGDSSSRHHGLVIPHSGGSIVLPSESLGAPQDQVTRLSSFKELDRSGSRDRARSPWSKKNPFAVRSFSMGTSRRLANAMEFLDLEGLRSSSSQSKRGEKGMYSPYQYGITETPDYHPTFLTTSPTDFESPAGVRLHEITEAGAGAGAGPSFETKNSLLNLQGDSSGGATMKRSSSGSRINKGRSLSFRSPFSLKRSLSGGIGAFSFRHSGRVSRVFSSSSPPPPLSVAAQKDTKESGS
jgi:hypothetical protein